MDAGQQGIVEQHVLKQNHDDQLGTLILAWCHSFQIINAETEGRGTTQSAHYGNKTHVD